MLGFHLPRWLSSKSRKQDVEEQQTETVPWPSTSPALSYTTPRIAKNISAPIPRSTATSLTGFDNPHIEPNHDLWRDRPRNSNRAHVASSSSSSHSSFGDSAVDLYNSSKPRGSTSDDASSQHTIEVPPPAVIRIETAVSSIPRPRATPFRRSVSSPPASPAYHTSPTDSLDSAEVTPTAFAVPSAPSHGGRWYNNLKVHTDQGLKSSPSNGSSHSLPYRSRTPSEQQMIPTMNTDVYGYAYGYPLVKQLSPIVEQDYASPDTLKRSRSLPSTASDKNLRVSASGSQASADIAKPSPSYPSPFISRPLNRTASQNSSRTHVSTSSATVARPSSGASNSKPNGERPTIALDTRGGTLYASHPSPTSVSTPRSARIRFNGSMPTILGSNHDEEYDYTATNESLHAESFVTATSQDPRGGRATSILEVENGAPTDPTDGSTTVYGPPHRGASFRSQRPLPSRSESFITHRWDRDAALGSGVRTFRVKKRYARIVTPAFWTFWLGFLFPPLWLVGGWHFTHFGEQPPRLTFWEFYFNAGYWKEMCCGRRNKKREMMLEVHPYYYDPKTGGLSGKGKGKQAEGRLPRWVTEKEERLYDPKRSLKGISFGYPFIPRHPVDDPDALNHPTLARRVLHVLGKPNRVFDQFYGVKLVEVRGRPESARRCFDPWIQRCRYALCYALVLLAVGLCAASIYLIVYNTRRLNA